MIVAGIGLAVSVTATWYLSLLSQRVAAPLPRPGRDRARSRTSPSCRPRCRRSSTTSAPSTSTGWRCCAIRCSRSTTCSCRCSRRSGGCSAWRSRRCCSASIDPGAGAAAVRRCPRSGSATWRPAVERRAEESVDRQRPARPGTCSCSAPLRRRPRRCASPNTGDWLVSERRAAWERWYAPVSKVRWRPRRGTPLAWAIFAGAYVGAIVYVATGLDRAVGDVVLVLAAGNRLARVRRRDGRRARLPPRLLARLVAAADVARGLRRGHRRVGRRRRHADAADRRDRLRARVVQLSRAPIAWCSTTSHCSCRPGAVVAVVGENGAGKSTLVKLLAGCTRRRSGGSRSTASTWPTSHTDEWRARLAGAFQDFYRFELHAQQTRRRRRPAAPRRPRARRARRSAGPARDDVIERLAYGLETQLGPSWDEGARSASGSGRSWRWPVGSCATRRCCWCSTSRPPRSTPRPSTRCSSGSPRRRGAHADTGRVTVLVSHRFSTVRMADLIVVMDGAHVVEVRQPRRVDGARWSVRGTVRHPGCRVRLIARRHTGGGTDLPQTREVAGTIGRGSGRRRRSRSSTATGR